MKTNHKKVRHVKKFFDKIHTVITKSFDYQANYQLLANDMRGED